MNTKVGSWILYLVLSLAVVSLASCGGGGGGSGQSSTNAGSVALRLEFDTGAKSAGVRGVAQAQFDCEGNGIATVEAQVLDQTGAVIATGGPWPCTDGHGTITNVTPGQNLTVAAFAMDSSGNTLFTGEVTGIQVLAGQITDVGVIFLTPLNSAPVANAGPDQTVSVTDTVTLNGSASTDVDGNPLTYSWSLTTKPTGSSATLSNPTTVNPTFVVDRFGTYVAQLIVNDGTVDSSPATVTISTLNSAPVANAGPDQTAFVTNTVTLDGSASTDVDGNPVTYSWSLTTKPTGSSATLSNPITVNPTFVVDRFGTYVAQLIVNDGTVNSLPATVTISTLNSAPVANAGPDQIVHPDHTVTLDGSASSDVDGNSLAYSWSILTVPADSSVSSKSLSDPTAEKPTFVADLVGTYIAQLIVNDGTVNSLPDTVTIIANDPPVANAGSDQSVLVGTPFTLDGSGSYDPDGDSLTYSWTFISRPTGSTATLSGVDTLSPLFTPDQLGDYVIQLIVNDGKENSTAATVTITAINLG
jgi:K319L-like, PKD domain